MLQSRTYPTTTSAFERSLRGERHRSAHGPSARTWPPHHRPPRYYCRGGHDFRRSPDIPDPGVHSARRLASERPHRRCGPARSRYLAGRRSHRHLARYARAQHPRGAPMLERHQQALRHLLDDAGRALVAVPQRLSLRSIFGRQDHAHHFWRRGLGSGRCHRT